jgi:hypothetical protein
MALQSETRGYQGRGRFILKPIGGGRPFELGNVTSFTETIEIDRQSRQDYTSAAGGELDVTERVTGFTFEATCNDITPRNIAAGFLAVADELGAQEIADEQQESYSGSRVGFRYLPDPDQTITVAIDASAAWQASTAYAVGDLIVDTSRAYMATTAGTSDAVEPTWPTDLSTVNDGTVVWTDLGPVALTIDEDFDRTPHGIRIKDTPANIAYPTADTMIPLTITYQRNPQHMIQALSAAQQLYELRWEGLNAVDGGNPLHATYFRVKLSPTSGFQRHGGDDFAELTLSGTVLADDTRTGAGLSKYSEMAMI